MEGALPEAQPGSRVSLVNAVFQELQEALEKAVAGRTGAGGGLAVSKSRPRPDGLEFMVEGPGGSFRFLNSMDGVVRVSRIDAGRLREERLVTIGFEGGRCRTIERTAGIPRAPFRYSSVAAIVREMLLEAAGRADIPAGGGEKNS